MGHAVVTVVVNSKKMTAISAEPAAAAERFVHHCHILGPLHGFHAGAGQGPHGKTIVGRTVADRADEGRHHGPDRMDRAPGLHGRHLFDGCIRSEGFQPLIGSFAEIAHVDALIPGFGTVADRVAAAFLFFLDVPPAGTRHAHHGLGLPYDLADLFDGQHLAVMFGFRLRDHGGLYSIRKPAFFPKNGLEPPQGLKPFAECRRQEILDIPAPFQVGQKVLGVVPGILIPDLSFTVFCAEVTHGSTFKNSGFRGQGSGAESRVQPISIRSWKYQYSGNLHEVTTGYCKWQENILR